MKRLFKKDPLSLFLSAVTNAAAALTSLVILLIVGTVLVRGLPHLSADLFAWKYTSGNASLMPALVNTVSMAALSLAVSVPLGVFAAVYLAEYAKGSGWGVRLIRRASETLSGIPSIVYGLFGMIFFVTALHWGYSLLAGAFTLAVMCLPLIMRTSEEAMRAVPVPMREGSFGLGAGKLRTVLAVVLPAAAPGILSGVVLAVGRVVGETAALIFTAGTLAEAAASPMDSARTLSVHMYVMSGEGGYMDQTWATALVLIALVIGINALAAWLARRLSGGNGG